MRFRVWILGSRSSTSESEDDSMAVVVEEEDVDAEGSWAQQAASALGLDRLEMRHDI
jgi:hypothetical protein